MMQAWGMIGVVLWKVAVPVVFFFVSISAVRALRDIRDALRERNHSG